MTNFEEQLKNLCNNLEAQKQAFKQERWTQIEAGELAEFKRRQEQTCSEGIIALQQQKNAAISQETERLRSALDAEVDAAFTKIAQNLEAAKQNIPTIKEA